MVVPMDPSPALRQYANPERLVTSEWLAEHLNDNGLVVVEADEDLRLYETGHIPGALKIDWRAELNDRLTRDFLSAVDFTRLCSEKGIDRDDTIVFYGDNHNWWAGYALWVFAMFEHHDLRLLDGGRQKWVSEGRELTRDLPERMRTPYPAVDRVDMRIRAFRDQVETHIKIGHSLIDVRTPEEYRGELLSEPGYPQEGAIRGGHIPGAWNIPWYEAVNDDGTFKSADQLRAIYTDRMDLLPQDQVVVYCRIGERASHTWFVLHYLLGMPAVRNYDGSWLEWGNSVQTPIVCGSRPGGFSA